MKHRILYIMVLLFAALQVFADSTTKYEYDAVNRLTKVVYGNGVTVTYTYDELGNRTGKKVVGKQQNTGDVNTDGVVDVADIASVISVMAGDADIPRAKADVNGDGVVDVADIATVIGVMADN